MPAKRKKTDNNTTGASPAAHQIGAPVEEMPAQTSPGESAPADDRFENTPILPLRGLIVYPETIVPLLVGQPRSVRLVDDLSIGEGLIALFASLDADNESPGPDELYRVGTLASVERMFRASDGTIRLLLQGLNRIRLDHVTSTEPYLRGTVIAAPEIVEQGIEVEALMRNIQELFTRFSHLVSSLPDDLLAALSGMGNPLQVAYTIATYVRMSLEDGQALLEDDHLAGKLRRLAGLLGRELELLELGQKIQSEAQSEIEKVQREYFLREQLKAIQRELGEGDEQQADVHEFREKIEQVGMSEEARKEALRELERLEKLPTAAAEYGVIRNYLDWLTALPWSRMTDDNLDIAHAREVLDDDHYGLDANALRYTPRGGKITVSVGLEGADAVLRVRDSGQGIPAALLPRIFDLFVRG